MYNETRRVRLRLRGRVSALSSQLWPLLSIVPGSFHESFAHERLKAYVCILYASPCAPLLVLWLGEVEGTSLAMT